MTTADGVMVREKIVVIAVHIGLSCVVVLLNGWRDNFLSTLLPAIGWAEICVS